MKQKAFCCGDIELAGYLDGRLSPEEQEAVERHISSRIENRERLDVIRQVLHPKDSMPEASSVPAQAIDKAIRLCQRERDALDIVFSLADDVLRIVRTAQDIVVAPFPLTPAFRAPGALASSMAIITKKFDEIAVDVAVERLSHARCGLILTVSELDASLPARTLRAELSSVGREIASCLLEHGKTVFEDLKPGRYDITLKHQASLLGRVALKIEK